MILWFNPTKAIQAAGVLLDFEDGRMEYLRLLKLLYIADRESIKETGRPISFSSATAMDHGPLSSEVYALITGTRDGFQQWATFIRTHGHEAARVKPIERGELSKFEIDKLNAVSQKHERLNTWDLANKTHSFKEWQQFKPEKGSSRPIPFVAILDAIGFTTEEKGEIVKDLQAKAQADRIFAGVHS